MNLVDSIKGSVDPILGIRDMLGAAIRKVYFVTRTWTGEQPGDGTYTEETAQVLPAPGVKDYSHDLRVKEGGVIQEGDLIVHGVSKNQYSEADVNAKSNDSRIEKLYKVGDSYYRLVTVREKHVTWDLHLRRLTDQRRV